VDNSVSERAPIANNKNFAKDIKGPLHIRSSSQKYLDKEQQSTASRAKLKMVLEEEKQEDTPQSFSNIRARGQSLNDFDKYNRGMDDDDAHILPQSHLEAKRINSNRSFEHTLRQDIIHEKAAERPINANTSAIADGRSAQSQSNEIEDLDEQKFQEVKVHQINQPYKQQRKQNNNSQDMHTSNISSSNNNERGAGVDEHVLGEFDDLANESANVIEFTQTGQSQGATIFALQHPQPQSPLPIGAQQVQQAQLASQNFARNPFHNIAANPLTGKMSQINQINQSGFHQRQSLNEHEINIQNSQYSGYWASNNAGGQFSKRSSPSKKSKMSKSVKCQRAHSTTQNSNTRSAYFAKKDPPGTKGTDSKNQEAEKQTKPNSDASQSFINENIKTNKLRLFP